MLSEAARCLAPFESATFHALHKRLCGGLRSAGWCAADVQDNYLALADAFLPVTAVIACGYGDITKPRSRKMPGLRTVRDGSSSVLRNGWCKYGRHAPLLLELFSVGWGAYKSQRTMIEAVITFIAKRIGCRQLWLFDRGFGGWEYFRFSARRDCVS